MPVVDRFFVDTNLLLYSVDRSEPVKRGQARRWLSSLWGHAAGRLSWQVLHEFYFNAERKMGLDSASARRMVESLAQWKPVEAGLGLIQRGWHWSDCAQLSFWDSLIVAAAERAGCACLLSEDFQDGRRFDTVTVVNPFTHDPGSLGLPSHRALPREEIS
ncbi:MAG: PIN domain-containing protein [Bryobacteraceae bacterium]